MENKTMSIYNLTADTGRSTGTGVAGGEIPTLENPNITKTPKRDKKTARQTVDISDLASMPSQEETAGVQYKTSIEDELLGEGSILEEYQKKMEMERQEMIERIETHNAMLAAELGEDVPEVVTDEDIARSRKEVAELAREEAEAPDLSLLDESNDDYVDPLEKELEEDDTPVRVSAPVNSIPKNKTLEAVEEETYSPIENTMKSENFGHDVSFEIDDEDLDDIDVDDASTEDEEIMDELQAAISEKIAPINKRLNLSSFKRVNTPVSAKKAVEHVMKKSADWALVNSKTHFAMSEFSGTELSKLSNNEGLNPYSRVYNRYKLILKHLVGENKPEDVKEFAKSVAYSDNDGLYGGIFIANFADSNYIPYDCDKCGNTFLSDNRPVTDMYDFDDEESESVFTAIRNYQYYEMSPLYVTEEVMISDTIAIAFREPSIYSVLFEPALLDEKFAQKYSEVISIIAYIDNMYYVDAEEGTIAPVGYKRFTANEAKDIKSRIIEYAKVISSLSPDEYNVILAYINAINKEAKGPKWKLPECTCPKCGTPIAERKTNAMNLVFMRHQLAALATTSLK